MESIQPEEPFRPYPRCACGWTGPNSCLKPNAAWGSVCPECEISSGLQWIHDPMPWSHAAYMRAANRTAQDLRWCGYAVPERIPNCAVLRFKNMTFVEAKVDPMDPSRAILEASYDPCWDWIELHMIVSPNGETDGSQEAVSTESDDR
jgi:hypothetical protein